MITRMCSECGNKLLWYRVKDELCDECREQLARRKKTAGKSQGASDGLQMVSCPLCGGSVYPGQSKCEFCGSILSETKARRERAGAAPSKRASKAVNSAEGFGLALLCVPVVATVFVWAWIARTSLLANPEILLIGLCAVVAVSSSVLCAVELLSAPGGSKRASLAGAVKWLVFMLVAWVAGYPLYLGARARYGLKNLQRNGIVVAAVFVFSVLSVAVSIHKAKAEARENIMRTEQQLLRNAPSLPRQ